MATRRLEKLRRLRRIKRRCTHTRDTIGRVESLEVRRLMSANLFDPTTGCEELTIGHGVGCGCAGCQTIHDSFGELTVAAALSDDDGNYFDDKGIGFHSLPDVLVGAEAAGEAGGDGGGGELAESGLTVPALNSNLGASATLYLDFDGHVEAQWGGWSNVVTKVYSTDGNLNAFSSTEINRITEIWARVAEDFAPFDINVTTVEPPSFGNGQALRVAIGGSSGDWYGSGAGGVAYINSFTNSIANTVYVFEDNLGNGNAKYVAEAASHEAGHGFGLRHQSEWNGNQKVSEYWTGANGWAPVMGVGYYQNQTTWHDGKNSSGNNQDDLAILAGSNNGFGYRNDDHGSSNGSASTVAFNGSGNFSVDGVIERNNDVDVFRFNLNAGTLDLDVDVAQYGPNLDVELELYDSGGNLLTTADPSSLGASINTHLSAGTYFLHVQNDGQYGSLGQYNLSGSAVPGSGGGDNGGGDNGGGDNGGGGGDDGSNDNGTGIGVTGPGGSITDGQNAAVSFGTVQMGADAPTVTFTVTNNGNQVLATSGLSVSGSYTIVEGLDSQIGVGASDTFTVRMNTGSAGTKNGTISFSTNDTDIPTFNFAVTGTVTITTDAYENNDSKAQVDAKTAGAAGSANLGVLDDVRTINNLTMEDSADWFRFEMDADGEAGDLVRIAFNHSRGDLDLIVYGSDGVTEVGRSTGTSGTETVSLAGAPAGVYYVRVYGYNGASNDSYSLTIDPAVSVEVFDKKNKATFKDKNGNDVTVNLKGAGSGRVTFDDSGNIESITIDNTNKKSKITLTSSGVTEVHDVIVSGGASVVNLSGISVTGDLDVTGAVKKLIVGSMAAGAQQTLSIGVGGKKMSVVIGAVSNLDVVITGGVKQLRVDSWADAGGAIDTINAVKIGKLISGGDFAANVNLSGGGKGAALGNANIAGAASGDWTVNGNAGKLVFGSTTNAFDLTVTGSVKAIVSAGDLNGQISYASVKTLSVGGSMGAEIVETAASAPTVDGVGSLDASMLGPALGAIVEQAASDLDAMFHADVEDDDEPADVLLEGDAALRIV